MPNHFHIETRFFNELIGTETARYAKDAQRTMTRLAASFKPDGPNYHRGLYAASRWPHEITIEGPYRDSECHHA